jgi:hypothetical protein
MHATCLAHLTLLNSITLIIFDEAHYAVFSSLLPLALCYDPIYPSSFSMRTQVSHPYKKKQVKLKVDFNLYAVRYEMRRQKILN